MKLVERISEYLKTSDKSDKFYRTLGKLAITYFPDGTLDKYIFKDKISMVPLEEDLKVYIINTDDGDSNLIITENDFTRTDEDYEDYINMTWGSNDPLKMYRNYTDSLIHEVICNNMERTKRILEGEPFSTTEYVNMVTSCINDPISDILKNKKSLSEIFKVQKGISLEFHIKSLEPLLISIGKIFWEVYGTENINTNIHRYLITYNEPILVELEPNGFVAIKWVEDNSELRNYLKTGIGLEKVTIKDTLRNEDTYDASSLITDKSIEDVFIMRATKRFGSLSNILRYASLYWVNEYFRDVGKLISEMMAFNADNDYVIERYVEGPSLGPHCFLETTVDEDGDITMEYSDDLIRDTVIFKNLDELRTWYKKSFRYMISENFDTIMKYVKELLDNDTPTSVQTNYCRYNIQFYYNKARDKTEPTYLEISTDGDTVVNNILQINLSRLLSVDEYYITNIVDDKNCAKELKEILIKKKKTYDVELRDKSNTYMKKGSIEALSVEDAKSKFIENKNEYPTVPINSIWDWDTENIKVEERKDNEHDIRL